MEPSQQRGPIWLIGMMGAGKSTVGKHLANRLGRRFVDLDYTLEEETGRTVMELWNDEGEAAFRAREAALVRRAIASAEADGTVYATGGGTPCQAEALAGMRASGLLVWLCADADEVFTRIDLAKRPLLADAPEPRARWAELARSRARYYRAADVAFERRGRDSAAVADEMAEWLEAYGPHPLAPPSLPEIRLELADRSHPILLDGRPGAEVRFAAALARRAPPGRGTIGLVTDETVARLHGARYLAALQQRGFRAVEVVVPDGEGSKTLAEVERVAEALVAGGLDRRGVLVALGGGVVGDLGGFVAATLFRGIGHAVVSTTLLAQVDASVGGKTAVNLGAGKNLVGAFHQPLLVFADLGALATLDAREVASGLGEVAKHALLEGGAALDRLENEAERARAPARHAALAAELVAQSCRWKARVVAADERELDPEGGRILLNLGHTVGHALETASSKAGDPLRHGEAVGLGLIAAARVGRALDAAADEGLEGRIAALLARLGLPSDLDGWLSRLGEAALAPVAVDKKRADDAVRYIALPRPGAPFVTRLQASRLGEILRGGATLRYDESRRSPS
jgi:shikimate kinase/3-dehydroquinate synthase